MDRDLTSIPLQRGGFCYTALITDVYSRMIVGWTVDTSLATDLPMAWLCLSGHEWAKQQFGKHGIGYAGIPQFVSKIGGVQPADLGFGVLRSRGV